MLRLLLMLRMWLRMLLRLLLLLRMWLRLLLMLRMLLRLLLLLRLWLRLLLFPITGFPPTIAHFSCFQGFMMAIIILTLEGLQCLNLMALRLMVDATPIAFECFTALPVSALEGHCIKYLRVKL